MFLDDEISSLVSLMGLLEPSEYFVTVDNSALWQKHICWAKSTGKDLRQYITQRYASSVVFLSCLLAAQINVFFNPSKEITEMRSYLAAQRMDTLKYWIGVVIMADICITILALVNTYTLSKLIASISDSNAHAMLRSSIGSYVAVLPSRFTVAALYLFLLWIAMFIWELFAGPIHYFLLFMVLTLFFHVIIPLSAFGRLIIHTGAMGGRPVLDVELEKELLPSGLHNSLLIRAMDRKRRYQSSTDQYRKQSRPPTHWVSSVVPIGRDSFVPAPDHRHYRPPRDILVSGGTDEDDSTIDGQEAEGPEDPELQNPFVTAMDVESLTRGYVDEGSGERAHHRQMTMDSVGSENFFFPQPAVLNATTSSHDIQEIVKKSMSLSAAGSDVSNRPSVYPPNSTHTSNDFLETDGSLMDEAPEQTGTVTMAAPSRDRPDTITSRSGLLRQAPTTVSKQHRFPAVSAGARLHPEIPEPHMDREYAKFSATSTPLYHVQHQQPPNVHPLLDTRTYTPTHQRVRSMPTAHHHHHRRLSRRSSSGSILGFLPSPFAQTELEEENSIRASLDMPLAPDLESQERLMEEQNQQDFSQPLPEAVSSAWLNMHFAESNSRRWSSFSGTLRPQSAQKRSSSSRSGNRRNLTLQPPDKSEYRMTTRPAGSRRSSSSRSGGENHNGGRNPMETIRSHPDEEEEEEEARRPEETTRLLDRDDDADNGTHERSHRRSYT